MFDFFNLSSENFDPKPNSILRFASLVAMEFPIWPGVLASGASECSAWVGLTDGNIIDFLLFWAWEFTLKFKGDSVSGIMLEVFAMKSLSGVTTNEHMALEGGPLELV